MIKNKPQGWVQEIDGHLWVRIPDSMVKKTQLDKEFEVTFTTGKDDIKAVLSKKTSTEATYENPEEAILLTF